MKLIPNAKTIGAIALLVLFVLAVGHLSPVLGTHSHESHHDEACHCTCSLSCCHTVILSGTVYLYATIMQSGVLPENSHAAYARPISPVFRPPQA